MHDAVLLAGGRSSRMGTDKAELKIDGYSLFERALKRLEETAPRQILISGKSSDRHVTVPDIFPGAGPPGGIYSVLGYLNERNQLSGQPLLIIPVDMPLLTGPLLSCLLDAQDGGDGVRFQQQIFPCVLRATSTLFEHLASLYAGDSSPGGERSMKAMLVFTGALEIKVPKGTCEQFTNINSPADLKSLTSL